MAASEKPEKTAYVYMVRCAGGQLYTGWTNDPEARLKAHQTEQPATVYPAGPDSFRLEFAQPQRAPTPGQAVVLYQGDVVLGGGTITQVAKG